MSSTKYYESRLCQGCEFRGPPCGLGSGSGKSRLGGDIHLLLVNNSRLKLLMWTGELVLLLLKVRSDGRPPPRGVL